MPTPQPGGVLLPNELLVLTGGLTSSGATVLSGATTISGATTLSGTTTLTSPTLTTPTLTTPVLTAPNGATSTGVMITKSGVITELTGTASYVITVPIPAGAWIHDIRVTNQALWTAATSATLKVGDTADDDGYFIGGNMKATDLPLGEILSVVNSTLWGGLEGAYLVAATGQRGPVATNFSLYYAAGSNILFTIAKTGAGTAGRTHCSVTYSVGEVLTQTVS